MSSSAVNSGASASATIVDMTKNTPCEAVGDTVVLAVDGSGQAQHAFDCKYLEGLLLL